MKIPEMTDEDFNASFGDQLARSGQAAQRSADALAAVGESGEGSTIAGAAIAGGVRKTVKIIMEAEDNDLDQLDTKHTEKTDQAAYHVQANVTTQTTTQGTAQGAGQGAAQAAAIVP